jgi:DNA-binding SARP family transcriptional activator
VRRPNPDDSPSSPCSHAPSSRNHARKILALLWPDEPEERARRSLNQAVYSLRRDLRDDDALLGAKDLRLNLDRIEVDTIEFDD